MAVLYLFIYSFVLFRCSIPCFIPSRPGEFRVQSTFAPQSP